MGRDRARVSRGYLTSNGKKHVPYVKARFAGHNAGVCVTVMSGVWRIFHLVFWILYVSTASPAHSVLGSNPPTCSKTALLKAALPDLMSLCSGLGGLNVSINPFLLGCGLKYPAMTPTCGSCRY